MKNGEKILFLVVMTVLYLPAIQQIWRILPDSRPLSGAFIPAPETELTWNNWQNGEYQARTEVYLKDQAGFGNFLIRLRNQMDYSLFGTVHAEGVVKGKKDEHFEYDYIRAYTGLDFVGETIIDKKMRRLKFLQTYLKDSLDIDLIFVLEPDKASLYPERIPEKYLSLQKPVTNYRMILEKAGLYGVNYIDMNTWFIGLKDRTEYPLFGQFATHWSEYAASLALDSLLRLVEKTRGITFPELRTERMETQKYARDIDYDIGNALNLLFRYKDRNPMAYPELILEDTLMAGQIYPGVLVVGDSYYWNIHNTRIPGRLFQPEKYWYFGKVVFPETYYDTTYVDALNIQEVIESKDVILLMTTGRFLYKFDWYLTDRLYELYGVQSEYDRSFPYLYNILSNEEWFDFCIREARTGGISLEEQLFKTARYIYSLEEPDRYRVLHLRSDLEKMIREDPVWMEELERKAGLNNLSVDEMIRRDAAYLAATDYPAIDSVTTLLETRKKILLDDPEQRALTEKKAQFYCVSFEEMLQIRAEQEIRKQ